MRDFSDSTFHPPWFDTAIPTNENFILPNVLERNAREMPDRECINFAGKESWSYAEALANTQQTAYELQQQGVKAGDYVLVWMPGNATAIRSWFAINYLGAVFVPFNLDYRGSILKHVIDQSRASLLIVHPDLFPRLEGLELPHLEKVLVAGEAEPVSLEAEVIETTLQGDAANRVDTPAELNGWDIQMVIFTSGTTGPSKGVLCSYMHLYSSGEGAYGYMAEDDGMLVELPLFHVGGVSPIITSLNKKNRIALYNGFRTQEFWQRVEQNQATTLSGLVGAMAGFLAKAPAGPADEGNNLDLVSLHLNQQAMDLAKRYDFNYVSGFNMTELSVPLLTEMNATVAGSIGKPRDGIEVRVVDDNDYECGTNEIGELVVRADQPWTIFSGYLNQPEATAEAWRNGWFHTGDLARRDEDGNYFFVDRKKDCIRRRGENVSSAEVEVELISHPDIVEAAAVGVASEHGEQDILVALVVKEGASIDMRQLFDYLVPRMPHYMVPRYFRVMDALPKTPTNKVRKVEIRQAGVTDDCWDRDAEGLVLKKVRLN